MLIAKYRHRDSDGNDLVLTIAVSALSIAAKILSDAKKFTETALGQSTNEEALGRLRSMMSIPRNGCAKSLKQP